MEPLARSITSRAARTLGKAGRPDRRKSARLDRRRDNPNTQHIGTNRRSLRCKTL
jgi:hypothetical protein